MYAGQTRPDTFNSMTTTKVMQPKKVKIMNPEKHYGPIPIDTDSELTEVATENEMSLQELKEFLQVNQLGVFRPGSVPIAEEMTHSGKHQLTYADISATLGKIRDRVAIAA